MQAKHSKSRKPTTPCRKCFGTGTEVVPGKGARSCECRRRHSTDVIDLQSYREQKARRQQTKAHEAELARAQREAEGVMSFFRSEAPDFITEAVIDAIYDACEIIGIDHPTYENDHEDESETLAVLTKLFLQTEMLSLRPSPKTA